MEVGILLVQNFFQEELSLSFEVSHDLVVFPWGDQLLELVQDVHAAARVVRILGIFEVLNLHKQRQELVEALHDVDIDVEKSLDSLVAFGVPVHSGVVDGVSAAQTVLLSQDLTVAGDDIT